MKWFNNEKEEPPKDNPNIHVTLYQNKEGDITIKGGDDDNRFTYECEGCGFYIHIVKGVPMHHACPGRLRGW